MLSTTSPARLNAIAVSDAGGVGARDFLAESGKQAAQTCVTPVDDSIDP
jgi:hypothetical protein